jgi:hypothetical protein
MTLAPMSTRPDEAPVHPRHRARHQLAVALRLASAALGSLSRRVAPPARARAVIPAPPQLEFHAEAGAPEGALYVDGSLVGHLHGVTRL